MKFEPKLLTEEMSERHQCQCCHNNKAKHLKMNSKLHSKHKTTFHSHQPINNTERIISLIQDQIEFL